MRNSRSTTRRALSKFRLCVMVKRFRFMFFMTAILVGCVIYNIQISFHLSDKTFDMYKYFSNSSLVDLKNDYDLKISMESMPNISQSPVKEEIIMKEDPFAYRHEKAVFHSLSQRLAKHKNTCDTLETSKNDQVVKSFDTGVAPLPYFGAIEAIERWFTENDKTPTQTSKENGTNYPTCFLPPPKECDLEQYSVVLMSHNLERLPKMRGGLVSMSRWSRVAEIILVWNAKRDVLEKGRRNNNKIATELLQWNEDQSHPLRIFFALENGLQNNLLNRYHPFIKPSQEAILFFDDDGPFFSELAMDVGFDLWKRNSDVQVGSFPRNIRFKSQRMINEQRQKTLQSVEFAQKGIENVHPDDGVRIDELNDRTKDNATKVSFTPFNDFCPQNTSDTLEYNFFVFPPNTAHMLLPSGSFLHRNYACFVWHPVFDELRKYILDHPTHPDDMTISTLVAQLSGRPPRTFPRKINGRKPEKKTTPQTSIIAGANDNDVSKQKSTEVDQDHSEVVVADQNHRKLLWQQKDWANMREEAINSISQYFGSLNPGSVGWCTGTEYQTKERTLHFSCSPQFPDYNQIPWVKEGGLGFDHC